MNHDAVQQHSQVAAMDDQFGTLNHRTAITITSGGKRNPAKLDLDAAIRRQRRRIDQACLSLLSTDATAPPGITSAWPAELAAGPAGP